MEGLPLLLQRLEALLPTMRRHAARLDRDAAFPAADLAELRDAGVLRAPLPVAAAGFGLGTEAARAAETLALLTLLGRGNLAIGRLIEAHVNAMRLVFRHAPADLQRSVAKEAVAGHLFGLWVTDPPEGGVRLTGGDRLAGEKSVCSGAGHVTRAVVTATDPAGGVFLAHVRLADGIEVTHLADEMTGMRAACTGRVGFDGTAAWVFGAAGDYLREPDFSGGAWRTSAVTLGGMTALLELYGAQLQARGRSGDPHQRARYGEALIAVETARLWMAAVAPLAEAADATAAIPYVGLARLAVERAALDLMERAQRSLGISAMVRANPVERVCRDLATYLRQPATDEVLTAAAAALLA